MLIRLISLVILFYSINNGYFLHAENNTFIFPKDKPSVFKKIEVKNKIIKKKNYFTKS